jgi:DNA replication protein DnaC
MTQSLMGQQKLAGEMFANVPFRRDLNTNDLERMRIPKRYWKSSFYKLTDVSLEGEDSLKNIVEKYILNMEKMRKEGGGFILYGDNGCGKSCGSVVLAKEFRRRGNTVLFIEAADLKRLVASKEYFDDEETYWERSKDVDVLIVDDFGKGIMDNKGFGASLFDELIRTRNANKRVTIITSNISPQRWQEELELKKSTIHALKECTIPVPVIGDNKRDGSEDRLKSILNGN